MKTEEIKSLFMQFENASAEIEGIECWSARVHIPEHAHPLLIANFSVSN
jgi:hypothetical protein